MSSGEEDATREIFGYTSHIPVPTWVEKNAYSACKHCAQKFSSLKESAKQHHCRLCGDMFCGSCTGKYHVPLVYEQKGKKGPTRVCIRCRDSCLSQREKEKNAAAANAPTKHAVLSARDLTGAAGTAAVRPSQFVGGPTPIEIAVPVWEEESKYIECNKCHKKGGKPHNCRTCGKLFCDSGTSKMLIPAFFEKKNKTGPARVCGECRFKIMDGAKLVEKLSTDLPELSMDASSGSSSTAVNPSKCVANGCTANRVSKNGYCAVHVNEFGTGGSDLATSASVAVRWEGSSAILTKVALTDKSMTLLQIDHAFKRQCVEFAKRDDYEYIYKNEGISEVFYDIFSAAHFAPLGNVLYIRKKVDTDLLVAMYARQGVAGRQTAAINGRATMAPGLMPGGGSMGGESLAPGATPAGNNPFRRKNDGSDESKPKIRAKVAVARVFHKPESSKLTAATGSASSSSGVKKVPPPPPGAGPSSTKPGPPPPPPAKAASAAVPTGPATPELFKARAKLYFGAL